MEIAAREMPSATVRPGDMRILLAETEAAADRALRRPADYLRYRDALSHAAAAFSRPLAGCDVQPLPMAVPDLQRERLAGLARQVFAAIETVVQLFVDGEPEVAALFARYDGLRPLMIRQGRYWQGIGRYDFTIDRKGDPQFLSARAARAPNYCAVRELRRWFMATAPDFLQAAGIHEDCSHESHGLGSSIADLIRRSRPGDGSVAVLLDRTQDRCEVAQAIAALEREGLTAAIGRAEDLVFDDGYRMARGGPRVAAVLDLQPMLGPGGGWPPGAEVRFASYLRGVRDNAFLMVNTFAAMTVAEDEAVFAALTRPAVRARLTQAQRRVVQRHLPDSYLLGRGTRTLEGVPLARELKANRGDWEIRRCRPTAGAGSLAGRDTAAEDWSALVDGLLDGDVPHLAQRRVEPHLARLATGGPDGLSVRRMQFIGGVYFNDRHLPALLARVVPAATARSAAGGASILPQMLKRDGSQALLRQPKLPPEPLGRKQAARATAC
ncbi:hypothetical protein ACFOGJ_20875 [Marinibaculum pumilum]|uniref:Uncharacterized protein n=1 Tax=Marinibaculum pumilum TaxID=1766165 RepID=A0ABV7L526_9PROT